MKHYNQSIDIWSMGCVLADLLSLANPDSNSKETNKRIFPGTSCFPLSPLKMQGKLSHSVAASDQLIKILQVLGKQSKYDTSFLTEKDSVSYFTKIHNFAGKNKQ